MLRVTTASAVRAVSAFKPAARYSPVAIRSYSEAFKKKEKAQEEVFFRQREQEEIKKLREALAKKELEAEELRQAKSSNGKSPNGKSPNGKA
ncbi:hypothetical protein BGZ70_000857 [Mortierella alpina]|uniref:ATPase inhibitor, mitochondrial n=1 Tax=Mortierella alpina TaxID=64518 RepID=A0A9P6LXJ3_MORAP|nr:hypothetical protein BGZ70_000857 [Mortierella alpina]